MSDNTLVLGLGNILQADRGVGIHMLDYLRRHHPGTREMSLLDGSTPGFIPGFDIGSIDNLIVINAVALESGPGSIEVFCGEDMDRFAGTIGRSMHGTDLDDLLAVGSLPDNRALIAVQPHDTGQGRCLSNPVKLALPKVAGQIFDFLEQWVSERELSGTGVYMPCDVEPARVRG